MCLSLHQKLTCLLNHLNFLSNSHVIQMEPTRRVKNIRLIVIITKTFQLKISEPQQLTILNLYRSVESIAHVPKIDELLLLKTQIGFLK